MTIRSLLFWIVLAALSLTSGVELRESIVHDGHVWAATGCYVVAFGLAIGRVWWESFSPDPSSFAVHVIVPAVVICGFGVLGLVGGSP